MFSEAPQEVTLVGERAIVAVKEVGDLFFRRWRLCKASVPVHSSFKLEAQTSRLRRGAITHLR